MKRNNTLRYFFTIAFAITSFGHLKAQNWNAVGVNGFSAGSVAYTSLAFDGNTVYCAYKDFASNGKATVAKYDGTNWNVIGSAGFSDGTANFIKLAVNNGTPYIVYQDQANGYKASVKKFDGTNWVNVGSVGFTSGAADNCSLAFAGNVPYIACSDYALNRKVTVLKFNGSNWVTVGAAGCSAGSADYISLSVDYNTPYVAYRDIENNEKATVLKFDGSGWAPVGSAGFSVSSANFLSLAVSNGVPFVAFSDFGNGSKASLMKYEGGNWIYVGTPDLSQGAAINTTLSFYNNKPYIAFSNAATGNKISVLKYEASQWVSVSTDITTGPADYVQLAITGNTPYLAFKDGANNGKASVKRFDCASSFSTTNTKVCTPALPYSWNGKLLTAAGTYKDTLTNANGCDSVATLNLTITVPTSSEQTITRCTSYLWNGSTYTNSGTYTYTTINAAGCDSVATLNLILNNTGTLLQSVTTCKGITWNDKLYTKSGDYTYVSTVAGCKLTATLRLTVPVVTSSTSVLDANCNNKANGSITVNATSGTAPYLFKNGTTGAFQSTGVFNNLRANNYRIYLQDANGCVGNTNLLTVSQPTPIVANVSTTDASCLNATNGTITVTASGGTPPYLYKNGLTGALQSSNVFTGLRANAYRIYVQDANGCSGNTALITIGQPNALNVTFNQTNQSCADASDGTITVSVSEGAPPYLFKNGLPGTYQSLNLFAGLRPNNYRIYVQDANGCQGNTALVTILPSTSPCNTLSNKQSNQTLALVPQEELRIALTPNPSGSSFRVTTQTSDPAPLFLRVLDVNGKIVYESKGCPGQAFHFGSRLLDGNYIVEVRQGKQIKIANAVKIK